MQGFDNLIKKQAYKIQIYSFSNNGTIEFPAFVTDYSDGYKSEWKPETVYGRMDPIAIFKNTSRSIKISFDIPNNSINEAIENMSKLDFLIRGLYPIYEEGPQGTSIISAPPMFRVKFANLISNVTVTDDGTSLKSGLLCYIPNFDFMPKVDSGFFTTSNDEQIIPKLFSATLNLNIIHEHPLGNNKERAPRINIKSFPHGDIEKVEPPKPQDTDTISTDATTISQPTTVSGDSEEKVGTSTILAPA